MDICTPRDPRKGAGMGGMKPPPTTAPESGLGVSGCQGARRGDGAVWGAMRIIGRERMVPPQGIRDRRYRSGQHQCEIRDLTAGSKASLRKQQKRTHTNAHTQGHGSEGQFQFHDQYGLNAKCGSIMLTKAKVLN